MILNTDIPKGVVLIKIPERRDRASFQPRASDFVPVVNQGQATSEIWQPDVVTSEFWNRVANGPSAPLSDGTRATIHITKQPRTLNYSAVLSDTSLVPGQAPGIFPSSVGTAAIFQRRSVGLLATLQAWYESRTLVAAIGPFEVIPVGFISSLGVPRTPEDGRSLSVDLTITEIKVFDTEQVSSIDEDAVKIGAMQTIAGGVVVGP